MAAHAAILARQRGRRSVLRRSAVTRFAERYSAFAPEAFTTLAQRSISVFR